MNTIKSDYLVSSGSFRVGAGTIMNIFGKYFDYNYSKGDAEADACAIYRDWRVVGQDIEKVIKGEEPNLLSPHTGK